MKKRLLSAALALAMVLTMLPLSVFAAASTPAAAGDGTERVNYVEYNDANDNYPDAPAWYVTHVTPASTSGGVTIPAKTEYIKVENGVSVGGYYYSSTNIDATPTVTGGKITENKSIYNYSVGSSGNAVKTGLKGAVTVIGGTISIDAVNNSSLTVDICGGTVTIKQESTGTNASATNPTKLTSLTINNSLYAKTKTKGSLTMTDLGKLTNLTLNNVKVDTEIKMESKVVSTNATQNDGGQAHSITLNGAETKAITLNGVGTNTPATRAAQTVNITNSSVGNITVKGVNNTVTLNEVKANTAPTVEIEGTGGSLNVRGGSTLGAVTVKSGAEKETTAAPSNITVETGSTVASIKSAQDGDKATGRNTIAISGTVTGTGEVTAKNSTVNVNGGHTGDITLETGAVNVSGNRASVGSVSLAHDATFALTGTNCTVGELKVASGGTPATVTFNVPNDPSNTLGSSSGTISNTYTKRTIKGGTWKSAVPADNLDTTLAYQLQKGATDSTYTYYTSEQLGEAIIEQGSVTGNTLTKIGDKGTNKQTVTFMNGSMKWGELSISPDVVIPKLPTQMNNIKTPYWSDGQFSNLTGSYSVPDKGATLNAGGGVVSTDVTKLTKVKVGGADSDIKATLSGNTIVLSGAVKSGDTKFDLELETDAVEHDDTNKKEVPVVIEVSVIFDPSTKTLTIANPGGQSLGHGVVIENTFQAIKLSNGSRYTFDGKGLVVRTNEIKVKDIDNGYPTDDKAISKNGIEVIVNAPGYTATQTLKDQVINLINGTGAAIDWTKSPAARRAVNAALATMSDSTVEGYINAASARARSDWKLGSKDDTAYSLNPDVWLVPYLEVNVSNYLPNPVNPSITATLTLKWRVEVHPTDTSTSAKDYIVKEAANVANKAGTFIAKQGTALTLDSDLGDKGVKITFAGLTSHTFAHQAATYDYKIDNKAFTVTHAVNGNLGKFVLDTVKPMIMLGSKSSTGNTVDANQTVTYFSTLQAAVDAAKDGELIEINSNYKGSTTINMTGKARTIYIQANGKNVVVANASGGLVEDNSKGSFYTIKLNRDNSVVSTNVTIAVNTATGGSASVSSGSAKPGDTVTVTPRAVSGYKVSGVTAVTNTGASVPVKANSNGTYTFTVPANATKVTVTPRFVASENRIFPDVDPKSWYGPSVKYCYETTVRGVRLMEGDANGNFAPNAKLTRAQMVQMLYNLAGRPTVTGACPFPDVVGTGYDWAAAPITWAAQKGYVIGYSDGKFHPEVNVSRQDMVLILYRYAKQPAIGASGSLSGYYDASSVGSWAYDAVRWAASMGILSGTNSVALNGYINGPVRANRCEVAVTLANFHRLYG